MRGFLAAVLAYLVGALATLWVIRGDLADVMSRALGASRTFAEVLGASTLWALPVVLVLAVVAGQSVLRARLGAALLAAAACVLLQVAFSFMKSSIPGLVPFYADPALAAFDRWLHGGIDPWQAVYALAGHWPLAPLLSLYLYVWTVPATALPVIIALTDSDPGRSLRFLRLYLVVWIGLGTFGALVGSSVGPAYYDALLGGDRFAGLTAALAAGPVGQSFLGEVQAALWQNYLSGDMAIGLGISAFPSVHVAIAVLTALYMVERSRLLWLPALAFVTVVEFISVFTGYHYAVDGYASLLAVVTAWAFLRRGRRLRPDGAALPAA